jgi:hypothetical protein
MPLLRQSTVQAACQKQKYPEIARQLLGVDTGRAHSE